MGELITLQETGVSLGGTRILRDMTLGLDPGEVAGVAGPNGSGKTTLLRVLATLVVPDSGKSSVLGAKLGSNEVYAVRASIGMISHVPAVIPELTLEENLVHAVRLAGGELGKVGDALRVVGLDGAAERRGAHSSFGMMRRVEVARLLVTRPTLLLLDEAFSGLDTDAQDLIGALIERTVADGGGALLVSHDPSQLDRAKGNVFQLSAGRLEPIS